MQISKIIPKKAIIPTLLLASSIAATNVIGNKNNIDGKQNIEYLDKNPSTLATEAGLLSLLGLKRKRKKESEEAIELKKEADIISNAKDWSEIKNILFAIAYDFLYEKEEVNYKIDKLIEKIDTESVDKELGKYAKQGLKYIKECTDDRILITEGHIEVEGLYIDESNVLFWSVFRAIKSALYPNLITDKEKRDLPIWIERGKVFMNNKWQ